MCDKTEYRRLMREKKTPIWNIFELAVDYEDKMNNHKSMKDLWNSEMDKSDKNQEDWVWFKQTE